MRRFKRVKLYNRTTGEPDGEILSYTGEDYCDYCGKLNPCGRYDQALIEISWPDYQDPSYRYMDCRNLEELGASIDMIFGENLGYFYCHDDDGFSCGAILMKETEEKNIQDALAAARIKVVEKLLQNGVTLDELKAKDDWE